MKNNKIDIKRRSDSKRDRIKRESDREREKRDSVKPFEKP